MTEALKDLLHDHADGVAFDSPDLDAIARDGDRRVLRRRVGTGLAAAAVIGALAVTSVLGLRGGDETPVATDPVAAEVTWATGSALHVGDRTDELGLPIRTYVRTSAGFVVVDDTGTVHSWREGERETIGHTRAEYPQLEADADGSLVGWIDEESVEPAYVVHDLATGRTSTFTDHGARPESAVESGGQQERAAMELFAIDGRTAYWREAGGTTAVDIDSGERRPLPEVELPGGGSAEPATDPGEPAAASGEPEVGDDREPAATPVAVEDGLFAYSGDDALALVTEDGSQVRLDHWAAYVLFSPDARWISTDAADVWRVYDTATGEQVPIDVDGRFFATGYEWLGPSTMAVLAARTETSPVELLTCRIPEGSCEPAVELAGFEELQGSFALPVGETLE